MGLNRSLVLYHDHCPDGFCAAWVARLARPTAEFIGVSYGQDFPVAPQDLADREVFILDFSYPREVLVAAGLASHNVLVLDHHESARETLAGQGCHQLADGYAQVAYGVVGKFDVSVSGARLTWNHFFPRNTSPWLVDYTEDRDLWRWVLPDSREISAALASHPFDFTTWNGYVPYDVPKEFAKEGAAILRYQRQRVLAICSNAVEMEIAGHKVLVANTPAMISEVAGELAGGRPFGASWFMRGDGKCQWSLRSRDGGVDVQLIAVSLGGGGHPRAAGFETEFLPGFLGL